MSRSSATASHRRSTLKGASRIITLSRMEPEDDAGAPETTMETSRERMGWLKKLLFAFVAAGLVFVFLEGACSTFYFAWKFFSIGGNEDLAERSHTQHDPLLGWVNIPSCEVQDIYGPGTKITINSLGFRGPELREDPGLRIFCSGDSFTIGYGVTDEDTWPALLGTLDPRLETVNAGQGGYGVDQSFLWFERDGHPLDFSIHLFAFIWHDFERMRESRFFGYGKPLLALDEGTLRVTNEPVALHSELSRWTDRAARSLQYLRLAQLFGKAAQEVAPSGPEMSQEAATDITRAILEKMKALDDERGRALVLVWLPTRDELALSEDRYWKRIVVQQSIELGIPLFDLGEDFRRVEPERVGGLFRDEDDHFTPEGNLLVAEGIWRRLKKEPSTSSRFESPR
ncbi:MAG: hypothetical protein RL885_25855 [Planctomycetota bacterium]